MEKGSGGFSDHVNIVLNPRVKFKAKKWLIEVYPTIIFRNQKENRTSVNGEEVMNSTKYNEDLKEFLKPIL